MKRPIIGYDTDEEGDWFAILDCGHRQHIRHRPPFVNRPWATTVAGRQRFLGHKLNCVRCDRLELPDAGVLDVDQRTSIEAGDAALTAWNELENGQWARILSERGEGRCEIPALDVAMQITPTTPGVIPPQTAYRLVPNEGATINMVIYRVRQPAT